ncbi:hypothetical protein GCM10009625_09380 [Brachybacterium fresconis]
MSSSGAVVMLHGIPPPGARPRVFSSGANGQGDGGPWVDVTGQGGGDPWVGVTGPRQVCGPVPSES